MQWALIFESENVKHDFHQLSHQQKILFTSAYLYRQVRLVKDFDKVYSENLLRLFFKTLELLVLEETEKLRNLVEIIDERIPDTDEFSEKEGSYAQNLIIALRYLVCFFLRTDELGLQNCVEMSLQNIDLINYEVDENYDESEIVAREVKIVAEFLERTVRYSKNNLCDIDTVKDIVGSDSV
ncbi:hypothetical protein [Pseudomonas viridiflava]|uniref:hypothetical protein n=1 Tax=Pseudomonas viridiflava TaxID=33069 RepID=UPI0018E5B720|nr:hypothetical protein [Pseudomonas viridiflava]MBI6703383.1 hypothetical protein [Pseudomonas viridiflava]